MIWFQLGMVWDANILSVWTSYWVLAADAFVSGLQVYNPALNLQLFRAIIRLLWYNSNRAQLMVPPFLLRFVTPCAQDEEVSNTPR